MGIVRQDLFDFLHFQAIVAGNLFRGHVEFSGFRDSVDGDASTLQDGSTMHALRIDFDKWAT